MTTHSFVKQDFLLRRFEFEKPGSSGSSMPLQENTSNQGRASSTQSQDALRKLQQTYYLERRCIL